MKNKKLISLLAVAAMSVSFIAGCGNNNSGEGGSTGLVEGSPIVIVDENTGDNTQQPGTSDESGNALEVPAGCYLSELTGLPVSNDIKDQRPIAVMVDNEKEAIPHYEIAECDIVYELMNSTANDRVTRLMCVRKDWGSIEQMGNIRSTRPTNISLAGEYNAILVHDGGPVYINDFIAKAYCDHLSAGFARIELGRADFYEEFITTGELEDRIKKAGISATYNAYAPMRDTHFLFRDYGVDITPTEMGYSNAQTATNISIPTFKHTQSNLRYNESTGTYDYYLYGQLQKDGEDDEVVTFNNVLLQCADYYVYDDHGYLIYLYYNQTDTQGYYITNGEAIKVTWQKAVSNDKLDYEITKFFDENGNEIQINPGKTYIALVPQDGWSTVTLN